MTLHDFYATMYLVYYPEIQKLTYKGENMKQFQISYINDESFYKKLEEIKQWCDTNISYTILFRIYSSDMDVEHIKHVCDMLDEKMPDALYLGCTANANILNGVLTDARIVLTCTVFEYETTQVKLLYYPFLEENAKEVVSELKEYCDTNTWVSSVEMHATMLGMSVREFCDEMSTLRSDIQVFGGGACNVDTNDITTVVFSKGNGFSMHGIVFLLLGGSDFHTYSTFISGWRPLKRKFKVTKASGPVLTELDGEPAFDIYQRFLNINKNVNLVSNTLEFPLLMDYKGVDVLRVPLVASEGNSVILTAEVEEGADVRLAYGDPETILDRILHDGQKIADFQPEIIQTFSCASRKAFWGDEHVSDETIPFNRVAPTSGFYTGGEFLRTNGILRHFNVTLVFAAMREGGLKNSERVNMQNTAHDDAENERITLINRFISFIDASTEEFEKLNKKLAITAITDGLTNLYNRAEIENRIRSEMEERVSNEELGDLSLIMLDIDDFKKINDAYGHKEGDRVIIALSDILRKVMNSVPSSSLGRWGGEEFMILLPDSNIDEATEFAETIRKEFASVSYKMAGCQTVSIGVIQAKDDEDADMLYSRVDKALYTAKARGKNQVVRL